MTTASHAPSQNPLTPGRDRGMLARTLLDPSDVVRKGVLVAGTV
jgi:hypothetical protein